MVTATPLSATPWSAGLLVLFLYVAAGGSNWSHGFFFFEQSVTVFTGRCEEAQAAPQQNHTLLRQLSPLTPIGSAFPTCGSARRLYKSVPVLCPQEMLNLASLLGELKGPGSSRVRQLI